MAYCEGPGKYFDSDLKLLVNNGLSMEEAKIAAVFTHYNAYDTLTVNTTAGSYLVKSVQFALREASVPVTVTGGIDQGTETYLDRILGTNWKTVPWDEILKTIEANKDTLAQKVVGVTTPTEKMPAISWKHIALGIGALFALKGLFK